MHRRTLILRRFGPLTFGLGYYEGGTWVDHQPIGGVTPADAPLDVVHGWLSCCKASDETPVARPYSVEAPTPPRAAAAR